MGAGDDPDHPNAEGGDLSVQDRRSIERHLVACSSCREHRSGLTPRLEALGVAAAALPAVPDAPSLWPELERRIAAYRSRDRSRKLKSRAAIGRGARLPSGNEPARSLWAIACSGRAGCGIIRPEGSRPPGRSRDPGDG